MQGQELLKKSPAQLFLVDRSEITEEKIITKSLYVHRNKLKVLEPDITFFFFLTQFTTVAELPNNN